MNVGGTDDIYSLLSYSTPLVPEAGSGAGLVVGGWQIAAPTPAKDDDEIIPPQSVPVVLLDDGQYYFLSVSTNNASLSEPLTASINNTSLSEPVIATVNNARLAQPEFPVIESESNLQSEEISKIDGKSSNTIIVDDEPERKESEVSEAQLIEGAKEKFLFLCAQCSDVFVSIEHCRDHMIKDHNMILSTSEETTSEAVSQDTAADPSDVNLPLRPIDTNSSNSDKSAANSETASATLNEENENDQDQENSNNATNIRVKNKNDGVKESERERETSSNQNSRYQNNLKLLRAKGRKKKPHSHQPDPDYDLRPFKCKHISCVQRFRSVESLAQHLACHTAPNRREYACSQCTAAAAASGTNAAQVQTFDDWRPCALHLWHQHRIDIDLYTCEICEQHKAPSRMALETHMRIHWDVKEFKCPECGKAFKQKAQLRNHRVTHIKNNCKKNTKHVPPDVVVPRWYMEKKCEICWKTFADAKCLKKHVQAVHSKLRPYVCHVCGHSSARKAMMQAHLRQHTGEKPYQCNTCHFRTGDHNSLRRHQMRHSGVRPYKCPYCTYASIQSTSFKNHVQIRHPGMEGVYHCSQCPFRTVSHATFAQHISDHNNNLIASQPPPTSPSPSISPSHSPSPSAHRSDHHNEVQVFPENVAAAQLIYQCLGAYQGDGSRFKADVTASSTSGDGTKQTITIEIPTSSSEVLTTDDEDTTHCFLQPDDHGGITIPAETDDVTNDVITIAKHDVTQPRQLVDFT